jgi:hypothetical protein
MWHVRLAWLGKTRRTSLQSSEEVVGEKSESIPQDGQHWILAAGRRLHTVLRRQPIVPPSFLPFANLIQAIQARYCERVLVVHKHPPWQLFLPSLAAFWLEERCCPQTRRELAHNDRVNWSCLHSPRAFQPRQSQCRKASQSDAVHWRPRTQLL